MTLAAITPLLAYCLSTTLLAAVQGMHMSDSSLGRLSDAEALEDAIVLSNYRGTLHKRGSKPQQAGLWFGPRLGRRDRRSPSDDLDEIEAGAGEGALIELLREAPWAIVPLRGGSKRQTVNYTPRLGRDSSEDQEDDDLNTSLMESRSPPFAPRLGRRLVPFSPRLGRDQPQQGDIYSPRLGRSLPPSPTTSSGQQKQH